LQKRGNKEEGRVLESRSGLGPLLSLSMGFLVKIVEAVLSCVSVISGRC